jgi:hypothetical protein
MLLVRGIFIWALKGMLWLLWTQVAQRLIIQPSIQLQNTIARGRFQMSFHYVHMRTLNIYIYIYIWMLNKGSFHFTKKKWLVHLEQTLFPQNWKGYNPHKHSLFRFQHRSTKQDSNFSSSKHIERDQFTYIIWTLNSKGIKRRQKTLAPTCYCDTQPLYVTLSDLWYHGPKIKLPTKQNVEGENTRTYLTHQEMPLWPHKSNVIKRAEMVGGKDTIQLQQTYHINRR